MNKFLVILLCLLLWSCDSDKDKNIHELCKSTSLSTEDSSTVKLFAVNFLERLFNADPQIKDFFTKEAWKKYQDNNKSRLQYGVTNLSAITIEDTCDINNEPAWVVNLTFKTILKNYSSDVFDKTYADKILIVKHNNKLLVAHMEAHTVMLEKMLSQSPPNTSQELPKWLKTTDQSYTITKAFFIDNNDGSPIYLCRGEIFKTILPGQIIQDKCAVTFAGKVFKLSEYEILIRGYNLYAWKFFNDPPQKTKCNYSASRQSSNPTYISTRGALVMPLHSMPIIGQMRASCTQSAVQPFPAGKENDLPLYFCAVIYNKSLHIGKLANATCYIVNENNDEISLSPYEVLYLAE
jgi:hypothetical protein